MSLRILALAFAAAALAAPLSGHAQTSFTLKSASIDLPDRGVQFAGPGSQPVNENCLTCHSAGMVLNQPELPPAAWKAEAEKMIHVYKAPIQEADVPAIVDYLVSIKGKR